MVGVDSAEFLVIVAAAAIAAVAAGSVSRWLPVPVVVIELVLGIVVGPELLGLVQPDEFIDFMSSLGLGMLFFFAGYEIDFARIRGQPIKLAAAGWVLSLVLAYSLGGLLALAGVVLSLLYTGSAMATTAIGTLIPILSDAGELRTRFGTYLLAFGALGEFGPILLVTIVFSTQSPASSAAVLAGFVVLAVLAGILAVRSVGRGWATLERTLETSSQLAVRTFVLVVFALATLAASLGLDLLLGGFVAGIILRLALKGHEAERLESKLTAVGYGFLIPFFFVASGVAFDMGALVEDPVQALKLPLFLLLFLVVRGVPVLLFYRRIFDLRDRAALAIYGSTELPLVVAITTIAIQQKEMSSSTAASLVGAAVLSTAIFPIVGLHLRRNRTRQERAVGDADAAGTVEKGSSGGQAPAPG